MGLAHRDDPRRGIPHKMRRRGGNWRLAAVSVLAGAAAAGMALAVQGHGLAIAAFVGALAAALVFTFVHGLAARIAEQERALEAAKAEESFRREFTANVAHELKTPLTAIVGAAEMMGDGSELQDSERTELMEIVRDQSRRLNSLVRDVLALAQIERGQGESHRDFVRVPLDGVVDAVARLESSQARKAHIAICTEKCPAAAVQGDPHLLEQMLANLVENAIRYSGTDRIDVAVSSGQGRARISVTDYGIGIPAEHLPHIFKRFYRVNKARSRSLGGTGLGLAIVKHIAILHGGNVDVLSISGDRTVFTVDLPLAAAV